MCGSNCWLQSDNESISLLQSFTSYIKSTLGNSVTITPPECAPPQCCSQTIVSTNGITESAWNSLRLKYSSYNNFTIGIKAITLGVSNDNGLTYDLVKKGNRASAKLLSVKFNDAQILEQSKAIDDGKAWFDVLVPTLDNVDQITTAFGDSTTGKPKCVFEIKLIAGAILYTG